MCAKWCVYHCLRARSVPHDHAAVNVQLAAGHVSGAEVASDASEAMWQAAAADAAASEASDATTFGAPEFGDTATGSSFWTHVASFWTPVPGGHAMHSDRPWFGNWPIVQSTHGPPVELTLPNTQARHSVKIGAFGALPVRQATHSVPLGFGTMPLLSLQDSHAAPFKLAKPGRQAEH